MATLHLPQVDSPIISRLFVKRSEITIRNLTDFAVFMVPIFAPLTTGSIVFWELITHGLTIDNIYGRVAVASIATFLLEFCGLMYFDYLTQVSRYNKNKPVDATELGTSWAWAAIIAYTMVSFLLMFIGTVMPAIYKFMGYDSNIEALTPIALPLFIILTFFTFKVHQDVGVMNAVYENEKEKAQVEARQLAELKAQATQAHNDELERSRMELEQRRANLELLRQQAEIEAIQAVSKVKVLKAEAKVATVKPVENFTAISTITKDEGELLYNQWKKENPKLSTRKAVILLQEAGCKVSHSTVGAWARKMESEL